MGGEFQITGYWFTRYWFLQIPGALRELLVRNGFEPQSRCSTCGPQRLCYFIDHNSVRHLTSARNLQIKPVTCSLPVLITCLHQRYCGVIVILITMFLAGIVKPG
jgi:hypothetical protein